ncbi:MAG: plasmid stabilization protein [Alphaproteobacteria bacterium]|nr:MAG: plasmid stabilization protein [Alphaproteobacteria bacterium]
MHVSPTGQNMADYRLSQEARKDLMDIAVYGDENFGVAQSNKYRDQLKLHFELLAEQPKLFSAVDYIKPGYRRSVYNKHSVYYRIDNEGVEIIRVLGRQDHRKAL